MTDKDDAFLEDIFDAGRTADATVSDDLLARVTFDAGRVASPKPVPLWRHLVDAIGGWPALGGVAAAGVAGVWMGLAPPSAVETFAADMFGTTTSVAFIGGIDDFMSEGGLDG